MSTGSSSTGSKQPPKECSVLVPTLGQSPHLAACIRALGRCRPGEILVVVPRGLDPKSLLSSEDLNRIDRFVPADRAGFSAANNAGLRAARFPYVATVNDDAVVDDGWLSRLTAALDEDADLAAVQGINLQLDPENPSGDRVDGCGIAWNRWYQAIQWGHQRRLSTLTPPDEIFGVSATAAVYRRSALDAVAFDDGPFDERLFAYYEDVDLAVRLRAAGWRARCVAEATARHAGSVSGRRLPYGGRRLIHGNRHLILARLLGRYFWRRWPRIATRDAVDLLRALGSADFSGALGIAGALPRVLRHLPAYAGRHRPSVDLRPWTLESGAARPESAQVL